LRQLPDHQAHEAWPIITSLALMIVAFAGQPVHNLTRPDQLMLSQFLLGFGSAFFLAPAMLAGIGGVIADPRNLVSFSVLFGMSQNIGGLLGSAILGPSRPGARNITPACWPTSSPRSTRWSTSVFSLQPDVPKPDRRQRLAGHTGDYPAANGHNP
jgi:hypothetical protein